MSHAIAGEQAVAAQVGLGRRFRIAMFSYGLPCVGRKRGGIEQIAHDLGNALADRGHQVSIFSYDPAPPEAHYDVHPLPCHSFVMSWLGRRLTMGYLGNLLALSPTYRGFDVVIAHGDSLLLPLRGRPVLRIMHGSALEEALAATSVFRSLFQAGVYLQELVTALLQSGTVAVSQNTRRYNPFIKRVVPIGIDLSAHLRSTAGRSSHPSILFVGAMTGRKRGGWLLQEFARVIRPRFPDARLHMVTTPGPVVEGVTYHTGISRAALVALYQSSWVYASPSTYEGFGLPYVEALACGTPVVATPNPGSNEVLDGGRFGRLVSDDQFADEICRLLQHAEDRESLSRKGVAWAARYDIRNCAIAYEQIIGRLVTADG